MSTRRGAITDRRRFILDNTRLAPVPHVGEISLHLADEAMDMWHRTEQELDVLGRPPPFWAFAWPGGQGLARYILDNPERVQGRKVLDLASGSGLVAIAAARCGSAQTFANDIDAFAAEAMALNAAANDVKVTILDQDMLDEPMKDIDIVLAGDVFYDQGMAARFHDCFRRYGIHKAEILIGDPGRNHLPCNELERLADYAVPVMGALEDTNVKNTGVYAFRPDARLPATSVN